MKTLLRNFTFSYIAILVTQEVVRGFDYGSNPFWTVFLLMLAFTLLYTFMPIILRIIKLPSEGVGFLFLSFVLSLALLYILTMFIPGFDLVAGNVTDLIILGLVLPSKSLSPFWTGTFSALMFSVMFNYFKWLSSA